MFAKFWKTLKIFLIAGIVLLCIPRSILPHQSADAGKDEFDIYIKLNDKEQRLPDFKDDNEALKLKLEQLAIINKSRNRYKAGAVKLDIFASRVANRMSKEAAEKEFTGHWNTAGEKPYHRYGFAGGYDHVSENAFGEWSSENLNPSSATIASMMKSGHEKFMAEKAPNDGHKQTVIDKSHNYVGIGYCLTGKQFRYYEEFIDRYFEFENIPSEVKAGEQFNITVKTRGENFLYFLIVYREKYPDPMTPQQIRSKGSYDDYTNDEYLSIPSWDLSRYRNGTLYKIPLKFSKEGVYYIQIFYDKKEISKPGSLNTKGKTSGSGIVIKVV